LSFANKLNDKSVVFPMMFSQIVSNLLLEPPTKIHRWRLMAASCLMTKKRVLFQVGHSLYDDTHRSRNPP
jgi:hypothetical protein